MASKQLQGRYLTKIGYPKGEVTGIAVRVMTTYYKKETLENKLDLLRKIIEQPEKYRADSILGEIVQALVPSTAPVIHEKGLKKHRLDYNAYGASNIEASAIHQMETAMKLPITVAGALMPDAHEGYGLPIGGVLATDNTVIPFGVGMDIGCRMCMTIFDLPASYIDRYRTNIKRFLIENTRFGQKEVFDSPTNAPVLEKSEFREIPILKQLHHKAALQLGTSGSGNHFVEYGTVDILDEENEWKIPVGSYVAILSHSGSRWLGKELAEHFTKIAIEQCKLPGDAKNLAWLDLNTEEGMEYWISMNIAGEYSSANHHDIHRRLAKAMKEKPMATIENHHNFAWKEKMPDGKEVIVHRKGATPAFKGALGIIPGSMATPGFIVRGKGNPDSLNSASHGAGRAMSRNKAKQTFTGKEMSQYLEKQQVELIGGGTDEAPLAYKDINKVMEFQKDLVEIIGVFHPRIVRMDG